MGRVRGRRRGRQRSRIAPDQGQPGLDALPHAGEPLLQDHQGRGLVRHRGARRSSGLRKAGFADRYSGCRRRGDQLMGQKINPYGFRLGVSTDWKSRWFSEREYQKYLTEDWKIRQAIMGK